MKAGPLAENRFSAGYLGRDFTFQKQSAAMRLAHQGRAREMVPRQFTWTHRGKLSILQMEASILSTPC